MATAALAQFENVDVQVHPYALVRSDHQLTRALDHVAIDAGAWCSSPWPTRRCATG